VLHTEDRMEDLDTARFLFFSGGICWRMVKSWDWVSV
jgi:hypothetical protein